MAEGDVFDLRAILTFLAVVVVVVPLARRLKTSPVLFYLVLGAVLGPHGFQIIKNADDASRLGELGVVFLMFAIGLELSGSRLAAMRTYVFGVGGLQLSLSVILIGFCAAALGQDAGSAIVIGGALAMSSTAIVTQLLVERRAITSRVGRVSLGVLLFQDLAVVPLLLFVSLIATKTTEPLWITVASALGRAVLAVGIIMLLGRFVLRRLFYLVAWTKSPEVFMAMTLIAIIATALLTGEAGLSMALGAFLAGLLLAETEYRLQIESDIKPFYGLLLGLFFVSIGMGIDVRAIQSSFVWIALSLGALLVGKAAIATFAVNIFVRRWDVAARAGLLLAGTGEFAFVLIGAATRSGLFHEEAGQFLLLLAGLSMLTIPLLGTAGSAFERFLGQRAERKGLAIVEAETSDLKGHVVIAGYGRAGQTIAALLREQGIAYVAIDLDVERTARRRANHEPVFFGDATHKEVLAQMHLERAAAAVITLDDPAAATRALALMLQINPNLLIFARARDKQQFVELVRAGVTVAVPETLEGSLQLAVQVLHALGTPEDAVNSSIARLRRINYGLEDEDEPAPRVPGSAV